MIDESEPPSIWSWVWGTNSKGIYMAWQQFPNASLRIPVNWAVLCLRCVDYPSSFFMEAMKISQQEALRNYQIISSWQDSTVAQVQKNCLPRQRSGLDNGDTVPEFDECCDWTWVVAIWESSIWEAHLKIRECAALRGDIGESGWYCHVESGWSGGDSELLLRGWGQRLANDILLVSAFGGTGGGSGELECICSLLGDVNITQQGRWPGDGILWEGGTENGEGILWMVVVNNNAGFSNGGGGSGLANGVDFCWDIPLGLTMPPPNPAKPSCIDDNRVFDPKQGMLHLKLARSIISILSRCFLSLYIVMGVSYLESSHWFLVLIGSVLICPSNEHMSMVFCSWGGIIMAMATMYPNDEPDVLETWMIFHLAERARVMDSCKVRSWELNMTCIYKIQHESDEQQGGGEIYHQTHPENVRAGLAKVWKQWSKRDGTHCSIDIFQTAIFADIVG